MGVGVGGILSHVPSLHHDGRSDKENSGKNLSVLLVYAPQICWYRGQLTSPLQAEVCHWSGEATQGYLGLVALIRKAKTQQVGPSASFLLGFSPCPLSSYHSGHKTDIGLLDLKGSP